PVNDRSPKKRSTNSRTHRNLREQVFPTLDRELARNRERLRVYWLSNSDAVEDGLALMTANQRASVDFEQCKTELSPAFSCTKPCFDLCVLGNTPCFALCDVKCGAPTCARTHACWNPTWLPY